jgi:hypothetical protein
MHYMIAEGDDMISEAEGAATRDAVMMCRRRGELGAAKKQKRYRVGARGGKKRVGTRS